LAAAAPLLLADQIQNLTPLHQLAEVAAVIQALAPMVVLAAVAAEMAVALLEEPVSRGRGIVEGLAKLLIEAAAAAGLEQMEQLELVAAAAGLEQHLQFLVQVLFTQKVEPPLELKSPAQHIREMVARLRQPAAPALSLSATSLRPHSNGTLRKAKRKQHR
jgi:hypothetical protein